MGLVRGAQWLVLAMAVIAEAAAAERDWAVGGTVTLGGVGYGDLCERFPPGACASADIGFKAYATLRVAEYLVIESAWVRLEESKALLHDTEFDVSGPTLALMPTITLMPHGPATGLDLFAKLGWFDWTLSGTTVSADGTDGFRDEGNDPFVGLGTRMRTGAFEIRLEFEQFDIDGNAVKMLSSGFGYRF